MPTRQNSKDVDVNVDIVTPIKERACDALNAVLRSRPRQVVADPRVMRKGAERC